MYCVCVCGCVCVVVVVFVCVKGRNPPERMHLLLPYFCMFSHVKWKIFSPPGPGTLAAVGPGTNFQYVCASNFCQIYSLSWNNCVFWTKKTICGPTTSSHMPPPSHLPTHPQHVGRGGGCFALDFCRFPKILADFLHVDSHAYLYDLQGIYRRQVFTAKVGIFSQDLCLPFY